MYLQNPQIQSPPYKHEEYLSKLSWCLSQGWRLDMPARAPARQIGTFWAKTSRQFQNFSFFMHAQKGVVLEANRELGE